MKHYSWLLRREFWENRAIWIIPAVLGAALILAALFSHVSIPSQLPSRALGGMFLLAVGATFFAVMSIYATWYLLDCLYADRKDRSILFWKSLPITDAATVFTKLATALLVIPAVYFAAADVTTLLMSFIFSVRTTPSVGGVLWHGDLWLQLQACWIYVIVTSAVWYLPVAGYLLVVSAWAKRAVMLWSVLPPLALIILERLFLGTHQVAHELAARLVNYPAYAFKAEPGAGRWITTVTDNDTIATPANLWSLLNPGGFLSSAATWIGVAIGVALVVCAIQLRARRTEI